MENAEHRPKPPAPVPQAGLASGPWHVISARVRIDSFNHNSLVGLLRQAETEGKLLIALDLRHTRFISLQAIQFIVQFAKHLQTAGGRFALVAPSEKSKRHFEIYGSLEAIVIFRAHQAINIVSEANLGTGGTEAAPPPFYRPGEPNP